MSTVMRPSPATNTKITLTQTANVIDSRSVFVTNVVNNITTVANTSNMMRISKIPLCLAT